MPFKLLFTQEASNVLDNIRENKSHAKRYKSVVKALGYLETNPRHPGLKTHKYSSFIGPNEEEVFEAYAENKTPAAYRIFWYYGPGKGYITILAITPHP